MFPANRQFSGLSPEFRSALRPRIRSHIKSHVGSVMKMESSPYGSGYGPVDAPASWLDNRIELYHHMFDLLAEDTQQPQRSLDSLRHLRDARFKSKSLVPETLTEPLNAAIDTLQRRIRTG